MGNALRNLVLEKKNDIIMRRKGLGGKGQLTKKMIDKIQNYYGIAIRSNHNNLRAAQNAVLAIPLHLSSTDEKHDHSLCPPGANSWCGWQRDKANGVSTYKHKAKLPVPVVQIMQPVFDKLSGADILETAVEGLSQNPNESLHHILWEKCPKKGFSGLPTVKCAACMAVLEFNRVFYGASARRNELEAGSSIKTCIEDN